MTRLLSLRWIGWAVFFLGGCAALLSPREEASRIAATAGMLVAELPDRRLAGFFKIAGGGARSGPLVVYIESDGAPWRWPDEPPIDPTPLKLLVLRMALSDPSAAVAYLGRPCQYLTQADLQHCDAALWTAGRFGETAVQAIDASVDALKRVSGASQVSLVGYSGGGAMAALVAARRTDIACLVTIASPLDTDGWTDRIGVSRLSASLNPVDFADRLRALPQSHLRGLKDEVVPPSVADRYLARVPNAAVIDREAFDHACCWERHWRELRGLTCLAR